MSAGHQHALNPIPRTGPSGEHPAPRKPYVALSSYSIQLQSRAWACVRIRSPPIRHRSRTRGRGRTSDSKLSGASARHKCRHRHRHRRRTARSSCSAAFWMDGGKPSKYIRTDMPPLSSFLVPLCLSPPGLRGAHG
ncbi:hypothetical protein GSI_05806 [Ganoderma sinense ZZ0214-1]|uniref:Uncharacterized protein n=1 Tax=Ganoderma sinense ZZ0214-1 TaxID=1077348 RepID=A0A2G8SBH7_9APHY|nr:hypothetical protein GSI_05806 [Ganoderma sinense ZZ0214-1]